MERYENLKAFGMRSLDYAKIPPVRLKHLARHASISSTYHIARMPENKRIATLVAFAAAFETIALDEALDVLDLLITSIAGGAKRAGQKSRLRTLKDLDKSALALAQVCELILKEETEDGLLRASIFEQFSKEKLQASIETVNDLARPSGSSFNEELVEQYGRVRRFLPKLLSRIIFEAAPAGESTLSSLTFLVRNGLTRQQTLENAPLEIVTPAWERLVVDSEGKVNKRAYILCFLEKLQDSLRRRDVYVKSSDRWGDPRTKLLQGVEWEEKRIEVCRTLGHPVSPADAISHFKKQLDTAYRRVAANFDANEAVNVDNSGKIASLTITNLDRLEEPLSLTQLNEKMKALLPAVDLTELLLEINAHTGFADEFTHVSESNAHAEGMTISICAVLLAESCNIGIEPLIKPTVPALTRHRLNWVK